MRAQSGFTPNIMTLGDGARHALALHCTMAFGGAWGGFSKAMPELTLTVPDMPSHGLSVDWDGVSDFSDTVYSGSLSAMQDGAQMDVIGHSFGAATALRIALAHPEKLRSLTLIEPVFFAIAQRDAPETMMQHDDHAKPFMQAIKDGDMETAARSFNRMWSVDAPKWDTIPERTRAAMTRAIHVVPDSYRFLYDDSCGMLVDGVLEACSVPTLIMRGELAHPAITATNNGLAARMPNASMSVIEGAGHMAPITHPVEVAAVVRELLERS